MQDVENNMDDLFRKASENYRPNAGDSGWEKVQSQLFSKPVVVASPVIVKQRKKNKALLLLLLLSFAVGMLGYYFSNHEEQKSVVVIKNPVEQHQLQKKNDENNVGVTVKNIAQKNGTALSSYIKAKRSNIKLNTSLDNDAGSKNTQEDILAIKDKAPMLPEFMNISSALKQVSKTEEHPTISPDKNETITPLTTEKKLSLELKQQKFYAGIIAGPEINQVKSQGFKKTGFNTGVIAGYNLNRNVAIETGIGYEKKYYFSDGKYFSMSKMTSAPAGMEVVSLKGSSDVLEIPVNIKYTFLRKKSSSLFTSAGISSHILIKENNDYIMSLNGAQQKMKGLYTTVSTGFASSFNYSIGYEKTFGKQNTIRIQPYIQMPLKGMGIGNMQVMSTGINIAITRSFH